MKHETFNVDLKGNRKVSRQVFDGTSELAKYIKTAPTNKVWQHEKLDSDQRKEPNFNDFDSLEEATKALEYGTDIYYENFKRDIKKVKDFINRKEQNKNASYKNDRVGFLPIVPKVLQGNPINMINQDVRPKPYPTAKIILEKANSCGITPNDMSEFYSIIFVLIQMLENRGIRCEIWITDNSYEYDEIISMKVKLKSYTQPLNTYKIQFPIIASDFHRRIFFRIKETNPDIQDHSWTYGYGTPLLAEYNYSHNKKAINQVIGIEENDIYIPSCQYFKYKAGSNLDEALEKIINRTNIKKYIKLDSEVIK